VVPILSCEGPWKLFLPVALFIHDIHGPIIAICPWIHRVGYGDVILLFVTLFQYEYGIITHGLGKFGGFETTKHILSSLILTEQFP
jgi:hypothetical protein